MAESVDALVSNTSGATHPGSIPGLGTETEKVEKLSPFSFLPAAPLGVAHSTAHQQTLGGAINQHSIIEVGFTITRLHILFISFFYLVLF